MGLTKLCLILLFVLPTRHYKIKKLTHLVTDQSARPNGWPNHSYYALDGLLTTCSISSKRPGHPHPWWRVYLGGSYKIEAVVVSFEPGVRYYASMDGLYAYVSSDPNDMFKNVCDFFDSPINDKNGTVFIHCDRKPVGSQIVIVKYASWHPSKWLILCEVTWEITADRYSGNMAYLTETDQTGEFAGSSRLAVDEDTATCTTVLGDHRGTWHLVKFEEHRHVVGGEIHLKLPTSDRKSYKFDVYSTIGNEIRMYELCQSKIVTGPYKTSGHMIRFRCNSKPARNVYLVTNDSSLNLCEMRIFPGPDKTTCNSDEILCKGGKFCIPRKDICNRITDCPGGVDELHCACRKNEFQCFDGSCIRDDRFCDGTKQCPEEEDEGPCQLNKCNSTKFKCAKTSECLYHRFRCDGIPHCKDHSDEKYCFLLESINYLKVVFRGTEYDVCSKNWKSYFESDVCSKVNKIHKTYWVPHVVKPSIPRKFLVILEKKIKSRDKTLNLKDFSKRADTCQDGSTVKINCDDIGKPFCGGLTKIHRCDETLEPCRRRSKKYENFGCVTNGLPSMIGEWPWMVELNGPLGHLCGGSLINKNWVLTAASCIYKAKQTSDIYLKIGPIKFNNSPGRIYRPSHFVSHPDYDPKDGSNNIGLIRLNDPIYFDDYTQPICLPVKPYRRGVIMTYRLCMSTGFGKTNKKRKDPDMLMHGRLDILDEEKCAINLTKVGNGTKEDYLGIMKKHNFLCAGAVPSRHKCNDCRGDRGSPMFCRRIDGTFVQVGIADIHELGKYGETCTNNLFSRTDRHLDFINEVFQTEKDILNKCSSKCITLLQSLFVLCFFLAD